MKNLIKQKVSLTHSEPVSHSCINQSTDLDCQSMDSSHYEGDICLKWVKMKLHYVICFNLIGKTWFDGMRDIDNKTMGYGWKWCTMKYQIVNNVILKNLINCSISVSLTWEQKQVTRFFRKSHKYNLPCI